MKRVAVLGGGPAGAYCAERLASAGVTTVLLDEKLAWEKPCGGGITCKAYHRYPFLIQNSTPKRSVTELRIEDPRAGSVALALANPMLIFSRRDLNAMMLERAERAGAQLEKARVLGMDRCDAGWRIRTGGGTIDVDYCVVATGARNSLRTAGTEWTARDTMFALGYYIPSENAHIDIGFLPGLEGYIWMFPRCGHLSAGICGKGEPAAALRARLERYLSERGIEFRDAPFYAHALPALDGGSWRGNRVAGDGWLAVGDAAGLVDPLTGEGIYYAVRSAELAAESLLAGGAGPDVTYRAAVRRDFMEDLELGSRIAPRFYQGNFLMQPVTARMIQFTRRSPRFASLMQDLFAGTQGYIGLKSRLWRNLAPTLAEIVVGARS